MSQARPLAGKTRSPRSMVSGTPIRSKKETVSRLPNRASAGAKKSEELRTFCRNSSGRRMLVRLQRPLPVIRTFRCGFSIFSQTRTLNPACAAIPAAMIPAAPPPAMIRSKFLNSVKFSTKIKISECFFPVPEKIRRFAIPNSSKEDVKQKIIKD